MYIQAASCISPQAGFRENDFPGVPVFPIGEKITLREPDYAAFIDSKLIRRMSRIIRMGVATAMDVLQQAAVTMPDAILTGTAYGCLDDTGVFLRKLVENQEEMLTPTAFIQSTHNTVGAQIALMLKCHAYNNTYVQQHFSFESALLDALLLSHEKPDAVILAGAADELTSYSHTILKRFGLFRQLAAGEGAAFFLLSAEPNNNIVSTGPRTRVNGVEFFTGDTTAMDSRMERLTMKYGQPDLVLTGNAGTDPLPGVPHYYYKPLCGEFPTASAFATWMATRLLDQQGLPEWLPAGDASYLRRIWIHQSDSTGHHAVILLEK
ncbi:beta-ketoacyl synthase chain length factor [Flavihumibacter petaseus]|uniref:Beta-ketoacyl synthase-like N-terminal domain-containing protein n=1 Tax=Flavihumibacter petaseus NBRC 106054 TaxID=1220578 RepID=A0A0E9MX53_9BACT|nr:beta-ketoacyl synthase chain length factor [Flavihumibacter petaseus]GAO42083.1 hypothetical protein FPE01S_01_10960 [Flavihumibacter petaseus NBRC 106054]